MTLDPSPGTRPDPATIKACCAVGYSSDLVSLLVGDSYPTPGVA